MLWGDEVFGWKSFDTFEEVKSKLGVYKLSEYENIPDLETLGLKDIQWPENLEPIKGESPCSWSGRVYQDFRVPLSLSARIDCKSRYVEILNPLMTKKLIVLARHLPDHLREYKRLAVKVLTDLSPDIPFNSSVTHDGVFRRQEKSPTQFWERAETLKYVYEQLDTDYARCVLPGEFIDFLLNYRIRIRRDKEVRWEVKRLLSKYTPPLIRQYSQKLKKKKKIRPTISLNLLAFRACIIIEMTKILETEK